MKTLLTKIIVTVLAFSVAALADERAVPDSADKPAGVAGPRFSANGLRLEVGAPLATQAESGAAPGADMSAVARIASFPKEVEVFANRGGFCLDLGCGEGKLSAEIVKKTKFSVFALAKDDADCEKARQILDNANFYGTRATAVAGSLKTLPFPKGYGNLLVTGEYQESLDLKEVFRALNPNGLAVIGGGTADAGRLKTALDAAGIKDYKIIGNYATFRGKMPEGVDDWTHYTPHPDNLLTSRETTVRPPFRTQWFLDSPTVMFGDARANVVQGRLIYRNQNLLHAWDSFNGQLLWERKAMASSGQVVVGDTFYTMEDDAIIALNAATGALEKKYRIPEPKWSVPWAYTLEKLDTDARRSQTVQKVSGAYWLWMAVERGVLYGLAQTPTEKLCLAGTANLFCAFDLKSGALLWKRELEVRAAARTAALAGDGLYFCSFKTRRLDKDKLDKTGESTVHALDAQTGEERWHGDLGEMMNPSVNNSPISACLDGRYFVWSCVDGKGVKGMKSFDAKTGSLVKEYPDFSYVAYAPVPLLFVGNRVFSNQHSKFPPHSFYEYRALDIATGADVPVGIEDLKKKGGCGAGSASQNCLYSGGQNMSVSDLVTGKTWSQEYFRTPCGSGPLTANGMLFAFGGVCHCMYPMSAPLALAPGGLDWTPPDAARNLASRLIPGPALDAPLVESESGEWTHYRGNPGHTGEANTAPRTPLGMGWERKLGGKLTPPSFGGGLAFTASRTGSVWALDQKTGEIRWRFLCGAGVRVTPAFAKRRVLFGSDDGWVYALDAKTGKLAWRFCAAPEDLYINAAGQMNSIWPSAGGVLVEGNVVYCPAGMLPYDGAYLYALDLKTGKPVWAKRIGDPVSEDGAPQGVMALAGEAIIVPTFISPHNGQKHDKGGNQAYRKTDGKKLDWYPAGVTGPYPTPLGSEAVADGDIFFYGGSGHGEARSSGCNFLLMDAKTGLGVGHNNSAHSGIPPAFIAPGNVAPVLGKQVIVGDGRAYDRAKFCEAVQTSPGKIKETMVWSVPFWPAGERKTSPTCALALAGNVVLAGGGAEVVAFEARPDGKELGRVKVPGKILRNSLAAADGRVFVVTEEGSVCCLSGN